MLETGEFELDYAIGWFGRSWTRLAFADGRPVFEVETLDATGRVRSVRARELYQVSPSAMTFDHGDLLLGRVRTPAPKGAFRARVRMALPPAPSALIGVWSGTVESNTIAVAK
jgi:hypothetical protein